MISVRKLTFYSQCRTDNVYHFKRQSSETSLLHSNRTITVKIKLKIQTLSLLMGTNA